MLPPPPGVAADDGLGRFDGCRDEYGDDDDDLGGESDDACAFPALTFPRSSSSSSSAARRFLPSDGPVAEDPLLASAADDDKVLLETEPSFLFFSCDVPPLPLGASENCRYLIMAPLRLSLFDLLSSDPFRPPGSSSLRLNACFV